MEACSWLYIEELITLHSVVQLWKLVRTKKNRI